jgi:hypothetical protein
MEVSAEVAGGDGRVERGVAKGTQRCIAEATQGGVAESSVEEFVGVCFRWETVRARGEVVGSLLQTEFKLWLSDTVPGTIVKQVRTTRKKGETVAETTTILKSYKTAD